MMATLARIKLFALAVFAIFSSSIALGDEPGLRKLTIAEPGHLFQYVPLYYSIEKGFFRQAGLDVKVLSTGRRDLAMKAVISGEAFASVHDPAEAALARSRGADVKIIAPVVNVAALWLVADKEMTLDTKTWRGKSIALPTPPNTPNSIFLKELRENGWVGVDRVTYKMKGDDDPSHYLKILYGGFGTDVTLVINGQANMALALEPGASTMIVKADKHVLKDYPETIGPFLNSTINVTEEEIKSDRLTVQKFVDALTRGYRDAQDHPEELAKVSKQLFPDTDRVVMDAAIKRMLAAKSFPTDTIFTKQAYEKNLEYLRLGEPNNAAGNIKWEDIADTSFAEAASKRTQ